MKKTVLILLLTALGTSFLPADTPEPTPAETGYSFGVLMGQSLHSAGVAYDLDQVIQGLRDQLTPGSKVHIETEQAKAILTAALTALQAKAAQEQVDKEKAWLGDHAKTKGVVTTATGLQYEVLSKGTGVLPTATDWVKVDYVGTLVDGTEFDSSVSRGEPAVFPLNQVIPGWTEGIGLMPVGSKFRLTIPSNLAYGAKGAGGVIPPYATLVFVVDLISIEQPPAEAAPDAAPEAPAK